MQDKSDRRLLKENIADTIIAWMIFRKLLRNAKDTDAYKLKLIDKDFKILRKPKGRKEEEAMTVLDKLIFRIQHLLGPKITLIAYTGLMLSSVDAQKKATNLMTEADLGRELQLDAYAGTLAGKLSDISRLDAKEQDYVINKLVVELLK
jgi:hypothetical protein